MKTQKFIRLVMSNKQEFVLPFEKAQAVINSPSQIVMIRDKEGELTGEIINKAFLICAERDYEYENKQKAEKKHLSDIKQKLIK